MPCMNFKYIPYDINGPYYIGFAGTQSPMGDLYLPDYISGSPLRGLYEETFMEATHLHRCRLPETLEFMGHHCFYDSGLVEVIIPPKLEIIPEWCYGYCKNLQSMYISSSVHTVENYGLYGCTSLKNLTFKLGLKTIRPYAFAHLHEIENIILPVSVEEIDSMAFAFNYNLKVITLLHNIKYIGDNVFHLSEKVKAYVEVDTYAETYCKKNKINYKILKMEDS